jgi:hypothetical protein
MGTSVVSSGTEILRSAAALPHRRKGVSSLRLCSDFASNLGMTRRGSDLHYGYRMRWVRDVTRDYWFELLIGALTATALFELILAPDAPERSLWFTVPAVAILMFPLFMRRWFPFGAPAAYWILATALCFVDGVLIPSIESLFLVGLASAALLGNLRDARQAWTGLAIVLPGITAVSTTSPATRAQSSS